MSTNYYRITAYNPDIDMTCIFDSNGYFKTMKDFTDFLESKNFQIIEATDDSSFLDINMTKCEREPNKLICKAYMSGKATQGRYKLSEKIYIAIKVNQKAYIPNKNIEV